MSVDPNTVVTREAGVSARAAALSQPSSSYFGKRGVSATKGNAESQDMDVDLPRPLSRPSSSSNATLESYRLPKLVPARSTQSGSAFDSFALHNSLSTAATPETSSSQQRQRTAEQEKRHQAWKDRMLAPGGIMPRRRSLALDEAAAAEARGQVIGEGADEDEEGQGEEAAVDEEEEAGKKAAAGVGSRLKEKYAAKPVASAKGKGKKKEEVGPSGLTYTPLEKQYMEIKAQWPDVLLLTEGESSTVTPVLTVDSRIQIQVGDICGICY
jgi:DNA mismatch repair protein MSH3